MARAPLHARPRARHGRSLRFTTAALAVAALGTAVTVASTSGASSASRPAYIAAAEYFGEGNAYNLWNASMANAKQELSQMKQDGFNAVALVVPWGEFQTGVTPPRYNPGAFSRLNTVITDAKKLGMGVILRLSYFWDLDPADQMNTLVRFDKVWGTGKVYSSWLAYIGKIHKDVAKYGNVWGAYLSWEDLWQPVQEAQGLTTPSLQLSLASSSGYQRWLQSGSGMTLAQVGADYGATFASFAQVPTPSSQRPAFRLMFEYQDWALIHHMFQPAAKRYPGLTLEARVDIDAIRTGTQVVGSYGHTSQFALPGTKVTGIYYTPYMGDTAPTKTETATQAIAAMQKTFSTLTSKTGSRKLFLYEYQFGRNSSEIAGNPQVIPSQLPQFLAGSVPLLKQYTSGYALWTFRDYNLSAVYNPSFTEGSQGWQLSGGARVTGRSGARQASLRRGASITQKLAIPSGPTTPPTVTLVAKATAPASLEVQLGSTPPQAVSVQPGTHSYSLTFHPAAIANSLRIAATAGTAGVTNVQLYSTTLLGNVHSITGKPDVAAAPLKAVNQQLTTKG